MPSFVEIGSPVLEKKIFKGLYHIWVWRPSWPCDLDYLYIYWFPLPLTKSLISFAVTAKLICASVFAYADCLFSHAVAHIVQSIVFLIRNYYLLVCVCDYNHTELIQTWSETLFVGLIMRVLI